MTAGAGYGVDRADAGVQLVDRRGIREIDASFRMGPAGADHRVPTRCQQIRDGGTDGSAVADQQDLHQSLPWLCESLAGYRG